VHFSQIATSLYYAVYTNVVDFTYKGIVKGMGRQWTFNTATKALYGESIQNQIKATDKNMRYWWWRYRLRLVHQTVMVPNHTKISRPKKAEASPLHGLFGLCS
jgi:hypothetical protein